MGPANQGDLVAGLTGALATMSAVFARRMTGSGQHVDLSQQEALASMTRHQLGNYIVENVPWIRLRAGRQDGVSEMYRCSDGLVYLMAGHQKSWQTWVDAMGNPEWAMGDLFQDQDSRRQNRDVLKMMIEGWTSQHTVAEVVRIAEASRVPCKPVNTVRESTNSELLAARGHFVDIHHGEAGNIKCPGAPYKLSRTPWRVKRPAPFLGEHNEEVFCGRLGYTRQDLTVMRAQGVI
jgi:crotonobetainyl-CoA:carnitine CoA-transferase CaiB-like acyl-CoA transferase